MLDFIDFQCPYCGEVQSTDVDSSGGDQSYWQDCQICCSPILFELFVGIDSSISVNVKRDDE